MKVELFPFQKKAEDKLRLSSAEALGSYQRTHTPQVISFTAPTGAGKTLILASLVESIYFGNEQFSEQPNAIFIWISDSPELNEQSKLKFDRLADKIRLNQCITISDESFDREVLEDGHIYFLNTQKLGKNSNLTRHSDSRQYTIWETLKNTAREKSDHLYFIIDEAHRGMHGRKAGEATTIMQKFIKGSLNDGLDPMPVVIGMSATTERFNRLAGDTPSTIQKVVVSPDEVRASGLLKDRIVITYPEESTVNKDMAVLQAAADDWKHKWEHWTQYCQEQHYAYVNPIFVVQVQNGTKDKISETDLADCLKKIEERTGFHFGDGDVVHTFGDTTSTLSINGINVRYEEPSRISDDRNIKVVFFKENLSTGWDCPRAETMMSFRHATDATYIAQLLGRMVRTPMQTHIQVDDTLNDVHLFLPYFDRNNVQKVVDALQSTEGGNIPTDVQGESLGNQQDVILTVKPQRKNPVPAQPSNQGSLIDHTIADTASQNTADITAVNESSGNMPPEPQQAFISPVSPTLPQLPGESPISENSISSPPVPPFKSTATNNDFDREAVMKAINDMGLLTYDVRNVQIISNYLSSMYKMARLLTQCGLYPNAMKDIVKDIVAMVREYVDSLKSQGQYETLMTQARQFKLTEQIYDVFGESIDNYNQHDLFMTTDTDIERQFRLAEKRLGSEGIGNEYGRLYFDENDPYAFQIDVILFAADDGCSVKLHSYGRAKFHQLNDDYRRHMIHIEERFRNQYDRIVSDGDIVSKHNFRLPETIRLSNEKDGKAYSDHLFVNDDGIARIKLNGWEEGVLTEEQQRPDFICWLRNPPRKSWSLCIPYTQGTEHKATYPDFLIVRHDQKTGYVVDILEPHNPDLDDNLSKAQGFAEYARQNPQIGRIQLIRMGKDPVGKSRFRRLDMAKSAIREKVSKAMTNDELDRIFELDGTY